MRSSEHGFEVSQRLRGPLQQPTRVLFDMRSRAGLSQRELALRAHVAPNTIANAERGIIPLRLTQEAIARALGDALGANVDRFKLWPPIDDTAAA